ncbi:hypothetical protein GCM10027176_51680 [Actinoallomurus bryophytorum]|uniref:Uncharacterized protein n=1 Tax=Actinoallomurus bryophytorum TaxID=1490222 RepID=A0A543CHL3_9ACTN|nr:hypothetical protein [Actinoallomurus bryophytorum]TQL96594.1 hypothetical protein FB559_2133 [Actinoallomurus bryophytorum]
MKNLLQRHRQRAARLTTRLIARLAVLPDRARPSADRGANVVETIIIVAGFAILAAGIYAAVSGKVQAWIAKMP